MREIPWGLRYAHKLNLSDVYSYLIMHKTAAFLVATAGAALVIQGTVKLTSKTGETQNG
jgi:hypothetical protein